VTDEIEEEDDLRQKEKRNDTSFNTSQGMDDHDAEIISERHPSIIAGANSSIQKPVSMSIKSSNNRKTGNFSISPITHDDIQIEARGTVGFSFGGQLG
jgi:hypothetical protein